MEIIIKTFHGLEEPLAKEVKELIGTMPTLGKRAVFLKVDKKQLYTLNYKLQTALRILVKHSTHKVHSYEDVYKAVKQIDWASIMKRDHSFIIDATVYSPYFKNSQFVIHKTKDAIVDQFYERFGSRPSINKDNPDFRFNIHISERTLNINLDSSGESLHKRGYKQMSSVNAPLNEVLAAGLLKLSAWDRDVSLLDPMCGSGTFLTEAAFMKYNFPAQYMRPHFSFMNWKDYDESMWKDISGPQDIPIEENKKSIIGYDNYPKDIISLSSDLMRNKLHRLIKVKESDFFNSDPLDGPHHIIMNPPYDKRLQLDDAKQFYKTIGDTLKQKCKDSTAWILSGNKEAIKHVGLRPGKKITVYNGPIESKFYKFELF